MQHRLLEVVAGRAAVRVTGAEERASQVRVAVEAIGARDVDVLPGGQRPDGSPADLVAVVERHGDLVVRGPVPGVPGVAVVELVVAHQHELVRAVGADVEIAVARPDLERLSPVDARVALDRLAHRTDLRLDPRAPLPAAAAPEVVQQERELVAHQGEVVACRVAVQEPLVVLAGQILELGDHAGDGADVPFEAAVGDLGVDGTVPPVGLLGLGPGREHHRVLRPVGPCGIPALPALGPAREHVMLRLERAGVQSDDFASQRRQVGRDDELRRLGRRHLQGSVDQGPGRARPALEEPLHLPVGPETLGEALPASGDARGEDRAQPHLPPDRLDRHPRLSGPECQAVHLGQAIVEIVVDQHDLQREALSTVAGNEAGRGDQGFEGPDHPAGRDRAQ